MVFVYNFFKENVTILPHRSQLLQRTDKPTNAFNMEPDHYDDTNLGWVREFFMVSLATMFVQLGQCSLPESSDSAEFDQLFPKRKCDDPNFVLSETRVVKLDTSHRTYYRMQQSKLFLCQSSLKSTD